MILIIDNYDSFTYNLVQQIQVLGQETTVVLNDRIEVRQIHQLQPAKIVISPGWGTPNDSGICTDIIRNFSGEIPILGICMGFQCIGTAFGSKTIPAAELLYGQTSKITHQSSALFKGIPKHFPAARYNSLSLDKVPQGFTLTAWDTAGDIMAMEKAEDHIYGIQFHPESFMTKAGDRIIRNFLNAN